MRIDCRRCGWFIGAGMHGRAVDGDDGSVHGWRCWRECDFDCVYGMCGDVQQAWERVGGHVPWERCVAD